MLENLTELKIRSEEDVLLMVKRIDTSESRNAMTYQKIIVRDKFDHEATVFNFNAAVRIAVPSVVKMRVIVKEYNNNPDYHLVNFIPVEGGRLDDFMPKSRINQLDAWNYIVKKANVLRPDLKKLVGKVLTSDKERFVTAPLMQSQSFARKNGILEATMVLTSITERAASALGLDADLMMAGAMLYYVGHTDLLDEAYVSTADDVLIGAGLAAYDKLMTQVHEMQPENMQDVKLLCHILTSRYKGNPTAIAEAFVLRHLDAIVTETDAIRSASLGKEPGSIVTVNGIGRLYQRL